MSTITVDKSTFSNVVNAIGPNPLYGGLLTSLMNSNPGLSSEVSFVFEAANDGDYLLEVDYAAGTEIRAVSVILNGLLVSRNALAGLSPGGKAGWGSTIRTGVSRVRLERGANRLTLRREKGPFPHVGNLYLIRA